MTDFLTESDPLWVCAALYLVQERYQAVTRLRQRRARTCATLDPCEVADLNHATTTCAAYYTKQRAAKLKRWGVQGIPARLPQVKMLVHEHVPVEFRRHLRKGERFVLASRNPAHWGAAVPVSSRERPQRPVMASGYVLMTDRTWVRQLSQLYSAESLLAEGRRVVEHCRRVQNWKFEHGKRSWPLEYLRKWGVRFCRLLLEKPRKRKAKTEVQVVTHTPKRKKLRESHAAPLPGLKASDLFASTAMGPFAQLLSDTPQVVPMCIRKLLSSRLGNAERNRLAYTLIGPTSDFTPLDVMEVVLPRIQARYARESGKSMRQADMAVEIFRVAHRRHRRDSSVRAAGCRSMTRDGYCPFAGDQQACRKVIFTPGSVQKLVPQLSKQDSTGAAETLVRRSSEDRVYTPAAILHSARKHAKKYCEITDMEDLLLPDDTH